MSLRRLALLIPLILISWSAVAQNPILAPQQEQSAQREPEPVLSEQSGGGSVAALVRRWSNTLQRRIAELSRRVGEEEDFLAALGAFLVSVLFGAIHIAGPGHGKVFALSYFSARESRPTDGVVYSGVVSVIDSLSALVVVVLGYGVLSAVAPAFRASAPGILEIVSYSLIVVFGLWHLAGHLFHSHHAHEDDSHEDDEPSEHQHHHHAGPGERLFRKKSSSELRPWMLALSVGLIPCPVSTILLVYGVVNNVLGLMVFMVVGVSVGGFLTMTVISLAVIAGRKGLISRLSDGAVGRITTVLEFLSSGVIIAAGGLLLAAALS